MLLEAAEQGHQRGGRGCCLQTLCGKPCGGADQDPVAELLSTVGGNRIQGESQHRRHLTATGKQNGLIRIKRTDQQSGGKSLKGITTAASKLTASI